SRHLHLAQVQVRIFIKRNPSTGLGQSLRDDVTRRNRMLDPVKILKRSWHILWSYRTLWAFGLILALAAGGASSHGSNNSSRYEQHQGQSQQVTPQGMQEAFKDFRSEVQKLFDQGIPEADITGQALTTFLWVIGAFVLVMFIVGIVMAVARYVSETA